MTEQAFGILDIILLGARAFGLFGAFAAFAWALLRMRREHAEQLAAVLESQRELLAQNGTLSERLAALSTLVASLPRREEIAVEAPPPRMPAPRRDSGIRSYETAKRLARSGASVEEIVASSGVAGSEARLLRRLHAGEPRPEHRQEHHQEHARRDHAA